jgi:hypothetical protein
MDLDHQPTTLYGVARNQALGTFYVHLCISRLRNFLRCRVLLFYYYCYYYYYATLQPLKFGLGFPDDKFPFCSVQSSCSSSFYTHVRLKSNLTSSIQLNLNLSISPLPPGLPSSNFCTFLSLPFHTTSPSHSDGYLNLL